MSVHRLLRNTAVIFQEKRSTFCTAYEALKAARHSSDGDKWIERRGAL